jgi:hypothetical protein
MPGLLWLAWADLTLPLDSLLTWVADRSQPHALQLAAIPLTAAASARRSITSKIIFGP